MKKALATLALSLLLVGVSMGQANLGFNGVGARVGFVMPEDPIDNTIGFGLHADLGTIMPNLGLFGAVDYWGKTYEESGFGTTIKTTFSVISVSAIAKYMFEMDGSFTPYAGGGLGLEIGRASFEYDGPQNEFFNIEDDSDTSTDIGIHLVGGASMPLSPTLTGIAEAKYTLGDLDYLSLMVGVTYALK